MKYSDIGERFIRYASVITQSKEGCPTTPSTPEQRDLAVILRDELEEMGLPEVYYDEEHCYVYATLPGNIPADEAKLALLPDRAAKRRENTAPILGLVAHMDTVDAVAKKEVKPRRICSYDGGDIVLNEEEHVVLSPAMFPSLNRHKGCDLVVTDGTTVLGADDKSGIAVAMEVLDFFINHPEYAHGTIRVCFTPDEEVGNGTLWLDKNRFACDYAYTIDGGGIGDLEYENFNAATAWVKCRGVSCHPGSAKNLMVNALLVAMEYNSMLPALDIPGRTEGYQGFFHITGMSGTADEAEMEYIIRDHDLEKFTERKNVMLRAAEEINRRYSDGTVSVRIEDSYFNMAEKVKPHMHLIDLAVASMKELGIEPNITPIRGGTDGCKLSYEGIPCPNLGTGGYNCHGRYEYACVEEMAKDAELVVRILNKYASYEVDAPKA